MLAPISVRGARTHNLDEVDLDLPRGKLIVFCGVSGSGKTSMAIDTIHAEGQRRYIESFSAYTRQFLQQLDKPDADRIDGVPPTIAVTRAAPSRSSRTTVATATDVADFLRIFFARVGQPHCVQCGVPLHPESPESIASHTATYPEGTRLLVAFATDCPAPKDNEAWRAEWREAGFVRVVTLNQMALNHRVLGQMTTIEEAEIPEEGGELLLVVDRLVAGRSEPSRIQESIETALDRGDGACVVVAQTEETTASERIDIDGRPWLRRDYHLGLHCAVCNLPATSPEPRLFDFNSPLGACSACEGSGAVSEIDGKLVVPDDSKSLRNGAIASCPACAGARLRPEALAVQIGGQPLPGIYTMAVRDAQTWFEQLSLNATQTEVARPLLADVVSRLRFLVEVGVGYLTLDRSLRTLSTGEAQRVAMTATLGSNLVDMLYVLDEPTTGLHRTDSATLLGSIKKLRDRGNTVLMVEHEETLITGSDHVVEFGPQAGTAGGQIIFQGSPSELRSTKGSPTGDWLGSRRILGSAENRRPATSGQLRLVGASGNNLQNLEVEFPLGLFAAVTGVSGAGKSTLVRQTLYPALAEKLHKTSSQPKAPAFAHDDLLGAGQLEDVVLIDQSPVTRSSRSNPVTYVKAFDSIRNLFADQPEASLRGLTASAFSFNVEGGRCERCAGTGQIEVDMQFLADVTMTCGDCQGARYRPEVLEVHYRGTTLSEVLEMTISDAFRFFRGEAKLQAKLKCLLDVGLHYIRLGQPASTLSGGESQRLKLASYLSAKRRGRTLFLLDEPSAGLHFSDVVQLVDCFDALIEVGHSVLVVEHNVPLLMAADYLIDLGPGASEKGGQIVAKGTPEEIARCEESSTGRVLARSLERQAQAAAEARQAEARQQEEPLD